MISIFQWLIKSGQGGPELLKKNCWYNINNPGWLSKYCEDPKLIEVVTMESAGLTVPFNHSLKELRKVPASFSGTYGTFWHI